MEVVWFKRDLRIQDHAPLVAAAARGPVVPLYVFEPELWQQPDRSGRQFAFLLDCLQSLKADLESVGSTLVIRVGDVVQVLESLYDSSGITGLWSHEETGTQWTYDRDKAVARWARSNRVPWTEFPQHGVFRPLKSRDHWAGLWEKHMASAPNPLMQDLTPPPVSSDPWPTAADLGLAPDSCPGRQKGGRKAALDLLQTFLHTRGESYTRAMSSPVTAGDACSRLSPYLAMGALSMREATQISRRTLQPPGRAWASSRKSFEARLHWHCHFIQKLEDDPRIEFENMHPAYTDLRPSEPDIEKLTAWQTGQTGYPLVDACMRSLNTTGWLTFRMRAMVMSFAAYHLWLDWRAPALHLARQFLDYEPGIHYSQCQMQSGTTGINAVRIYNPIKQGKDHDPDGVFIRTWVPELAHLKAPLIHTPWVAPDEAPAYPAPIVDETEARKTAAAHVYNLRKSQDHKDHANAVFQKHGSRRRRRIPKKPSQSDSRQTELF